MVYHPRLNVLLLCGDGGNVSGWRLLDGFPHWAPALGQSVEKVGWQGPDTSNCMCQAWHCNPKSHWYFGADSLLNSQASHCWTLTTIWNVCVCVCVCVYVCECRLKWNTTIFLPFQKPRSFLSGIQSSYSQPSSVSCGLIRNCTSLGYMVRLLMAPFVLLSRMWCLPWVWVLVAVCWPPLMSQGGCACGRYPHSDWGKHGKLEIRWDCLIGEMLSSSFYLLSFATSSWHTLFECGCRQV